VLVIDKKFNISVISKACGILPHTLRAWESRYNIFTPTRDGTGKRRYSEKDLKKAILLAALVGQGHSISSLSKYDIGGLKSLTTSLEGTDAKKEQDSAELNSKNLLGHLNSYDIESVSRELQYLRQSIGTKDFILNMILPLMREVGLRVYQGTYTVTQEHIMSTIVRDQLSQIDLPNLYVKTTQIALATPEGNLHELAITIANILCRSNKVSTRYLGAANPADCLAEALNILKTPILVLGTVTSDSWDYSKRMIPFLEEMDESLTVKIEIVLGGGSQLEFPKFKNIESVKVMPTFQELDSYLENIY